MTAPDWAAKARERWPGCEAVWYSATAHQPAALCVALSDDSAFYATQDGFAWVCAPNVPTTHDPISAIEAAIRAEQAEARATLERLKVWQVTP